MTGHILLCANSSWYIYNFRLNLIKALKEQGYLVSILAPYDGYSEKLMSFVDHYHRLFLSRSSLNPIHELRTLLKLKKQLRTINADIVLSYGPKINIYCGLAKKNKKTEQISNISGIGIIKSKGKIFQKLLSLLYKLAFTSTKFTYFQNQEDMNQFLSQKIVPKHKVQRIMGSGVDLKKFTQKPLPKTEQIRVAFVGRLLKSKGIEDLIEAVSILQKKQVDVELHVYGSEDPGNRDSISIEHYSQLSFVTFHGYTTDIASAIEQNQVIALPSYYGEGIPRSLIEALATGRIIVTTDHPGCRDTVVEGKNGYLCERRNPGSIVQALDKLIANRGQWESMAHFSRTFAEKVFDEQDIIDLYKEKILELLDGKKPVHS